MPFRGPSQRYGLGPGGDFQLEQDYYNTQFEHGLQLAQLGEERSRDLAASIERVDAQKRSSDATRERLAMTPGVSRGGSTSTRSVADSPLMQGSSQRFDAGGETYSYDPMAAAEEEGTASGVREGAADTQRVANLQRIPGVRAEDAQKMVYGHAMFDDSSELHAALGRYAADRTQANMAAAVAAGASLNEFANVEFDPRTGRAMNRAEPPVEGTQGYLDAKQAEEDIRVRGSAAIEKQKADAAAARPNAAMARLSDSRKKMLLEKAAALGGGDPQKTLDAIASNDQWHTEAGSLGINDQDVLAAAAAHKEKLSTKAGSFADAVRGGAPAPATADQQAEAQDVWDTLSAKKKRGGTLSPDQAEFLRQHPTRP